MRKLTRRQKRQIRFGILYGFAIIGMLTTGLFLFRKTTEFVEEIQKPKVVREAPAIDEQILEPNEYSRPGLELPEVDGLVIHYTTNPGTTAQQNHDYFAGLAASHLTKASSHYIIGLDGEIIQCIPETEQAYASNNRNADTLAIECCHFDATGEFYMQTYQSLVHLTAYLMGKYDIPIESVIRHYDVTGKSCPKYFVDHPDEWERFLQDVEEYIDQYGTRE